MVGLGERNLLHEKMWGEIGGPRAPDQIRARVKQTNDNEQARKPPKKTDRASEKEGMVKKSQKTPGEKPGVP